MKKKSYRFFAWLFLCVFLHFNSFNLSAQTITTYSTGGAYTWTCPAGVTTVSVECYGGGGCGSKRSASGQGGGGGGGAYSYSVMTVVPATNYAVAVGAGGDGTAAAPSNGGNSTFNGASVVAAGGASVANNTTAGGAGGLASASTGSIKFNGGSGAASGGGSTGAGGGGAGSSGAGGNATTITAGTGTSNNVDGSGGSGSSAGGNLTGTAGSSYGGGGSGSSRSSVTKNGGNGADGAVILTYCLPVTITTQPSSVSGLCPGSNTAFSVVATGDPGITYQWQRDPNTGTFADITSAGMDAGVSYSNYTTATLSLTAATSSIANYKYRCVISEASPCSQSATSNGLATITFTGGTPLTGSYTIGGGGSPSYATLTAAFADIACRGLSGNINLVLQSGYSSASETFPLVAATNTGTYSISIYPSVSGLSITSSNSTGTFDFNGADNYIIDGRVNQAGAMDMIVENTSTTGFAIRFINDASYNTIKYCNVKGVNTTTTEGVILFSTASSGGNDYNTIDHCDVHDGASTPFDCINSTGTAGSENDNNTISNCNIYNFYSATSVARGIDLETGNDTWTISGNSLYQTSSRVPTAASGLFPIYINNTGVNYVISGNYVGGTASNCGGTPMTFDAGATQDNNIRCINVPATGTSSACFIQNNTVTNISMGVKSATANVNRFVGISSVSGYVNISNNLIGAVTGTGSITVAVATTSTAQFATTGILADATQGSVSTNTIGGITITGGSTAQTGSAFRGIECDGALTADFMVSSNIIGSTTTANSINYSTAAATPVSPTGIFVGATGTYSMTISDNIIQNISSSSTYFNALNPWGAAIIGIYNGLSSCINVITRNTIANITVAVNGIEGAAGIYFGNTSAGQIVSANSIHDISNTYAGATQTDVIGIFYAGPTTGANSVTGNTIYNLTLGGTSTSSSIYGAYVFSGIATWSNNMITIGNGITTGYAMYGIYQGSATAANNLYFNSVYIGGTASAASGNTFGFYSVSATHTVENNIFYNARTQGAGAGSHFAIGVANKTNLTSDYNDLFASTAANTGLINATTETFANWKAAAPAGDANSINIDPSFVAPTAATPNLHINSGSGVTTKGLNGLGITIDIDNATRSSTPDIGADELHTNYYSKSTGNLELVATWGLNTDGSGANPPNFTTRDCIFNIRNNANPTIGAAWTVSGSGDFVILGDGTSACSFTVPASFAFSGTLNISNNGTLVNQNTTNPTFNVLNSGSTVNYNSANGVAQTISAAATYGNLIISNSTGAGSSVKSLASSINIAGSLIVSGYSTLDMVTYNANRTGGGGTFTLAANALLKLSGTTGGASANNNFPNNFSTMNLASASTVEYYGATQTIYSTPKYGNLTITTAGTKTAGGNHTISGALTINTGATFAASTYTHGLGGNFINYGTFTANTSTMNFNGTSAQTIGPAVASSGVSPTFSTLKINNAAGVSLLLDASVSTALTLTSGLLTTGTSTVAPTTILKMQSGSTAPALTAASTSYVNGILQYQKASSGASTLNFPIGASPDCRPFTLTVNHSVATQYNYNAQVFNANTQSLGYTMAATVDTTSGVHYWSIDRTTSGGASDPATNLSGNQTVTFYFGTNDYVYQGSNVTIVKNIVAGGVQGTQWYDIGGSCSFTGNYSTPQAGYVTSTSSPSTFTSFSTFALGSLFTGWNSLPIELLNFSAVPDKAKVDVKWTTQTETNNRYFTVERGSDGLNFRELAIVNSKAPNGNSTVKLDYLLTDPDPLSGTSYYRLKQTDNNGKFKYFNVVSVNFDKKIIFSVYPNPNQGQFIADFSGVENNHLVEIVLYDIHGKLVYENSFYCQEASNSVSIVPSEKIGKGVYFCSLIVEGMKYTVKVIVE